MRWWSIKLLAKSRNFIITCSIILLLASLFLLSLMMTKCIDDVADEIELIETHYNEMSKKIETNDNGGYNGLTAPSQQQQNDNEN